jgi:hypothetical protein
VLPMNPVPRTRISIGVVYALAAAALVGASTPLSKLLLGSVGPWLLAGRTERLCAGFQLNGLPRTISIRCSRKELT